MSSDDTSCVSYPEYESIKAYTVTYHYDSNGRKILEQDSEGKETFSVYNDLGQLIKATERSSDGSNSITLASEYDYKGNVISTTDAEGNKSEYEYDALVE